MIIQCKECQTRFRLADEKIKPTGTKVRCSKCKHVFTVTLPEPEPGPTEEPVDFGAFNMESVDDTASSETQPERPAPAPESAPETTTATDELDFSGLEQERIPGEGTGSELADEFSLGDTSQAEVDETSDEPRQSVEPSLEEESASSLEEQEGPSLSPDKEPDFSDAFTETEDATVDAGSSAAEETTDSDESLGEFDFSEGGAGLSELSFEKESPEKTEAAAPEFDFEEDSGSGEFSFDEEAANTMEWGEESDEKGPSFDFDEPQFETEVPPLKSPDEREDLQFGEIDFAEDSSYNSPGLAVDDDSSDATLARSEESEPAPGTRPDILKPLTENRLERHEVPLPAPERKPRKSPLSRVLLLLVLLFLALGGAAGYFYLQNGSLDLNRIVQRFPILQPYLGQPAEVLETPRIGINILSSTYVNNQKAGQLLIVQGEAINNYPASRSAITIKGILVDDKGKALLQQTVFCGNPLSEERLKTMPFTSIEEAMNNQFGDSLSNMNVAAGTRIPFTVVFRNLPEGIANINIEVVDSKPGSS